MKSTDGWKYDSVRFVYEEGIMNGISGTTLFRPDAPLTRAMFATVLYRMDGSEPVDFIPQFPDVKDGAYYSAAISWAYSQGIVQGLSDSSYGINQEIKRDQIAKMLYIYAKKTGRDTGTRLSLESFTDQARVDSWAKEYIQWAVGSGIISGKPNGDGTFKLAPKDSATRAECAAMLMRFLEKYPEGK